MDVATLTLTTMLLPTHFPSHLRQLQVYHLRRNESTHLCHLNYHRNPTHATTITTTSTSISDTTSVQITPTTLFLNFLLLYCSLLVSLYPFLLHFISFVSTMRLLPHTYFLLPHNTSHTHPSSLPLHHLLPWAVACSCSCLTHHGRLRSKDAAGRMCICIHDSKSYICQ